MNKILIAIYSLGMGGAEKSLISLLNYLPHDCWEIDLIVANPRGEHMKDIPNHIHLIQGLYELENFASPLKQRTKMVCSLADLLHQIQWQLVYKLKAKSTTLSYGELRWQVWGRKLPKLRKKYDLAISYMNGFTNYYIMEKVDATKKVVWIHNEFEKLGYDYSFERPYFEKADKVVTISSACVDSFLRVWPELEDKITVLENISSGDTILEMAEEMPQNDPYFTFQGTRILSVGRLSDQKNFALAIESAKQLKNRHINFLWYILGEGELRQSLTAQIIADGLTEQVKLIGIRENPYPYINHCDVFVQTSKYEGKSIVLDEAKILCKPIVITNYITAVNSITSDVNGMIVDMTAEAVANGIIRLVWDKEYCSSLVKQLQQEKNGNEEEILKYIQLLKNLLGEAMD